MAATILVCHVSWVGKRSAQPAVEDCLMTNASTHVDVRLTVGWYCSTCSFVWVIWVQASLAPNGISIGSAVFAQLTRVSVSLQ